MKKHLGGKVRIALALATLTGATSAGIMILSSAPAAASALTGVGGGSPTVTLSNDAGNFPNGPTQSESNAAIWTWEFATASAGPLTQITLTYPSADTYSPAATYPQVYGLPSFCSTGTITVASGTVTIPLTCSSSVPATTPMAIEVGNLTADSTTTSFNSAITTYTGSPATSLDTATVGVTLVQNTTAVTVVVPQSLSFTNSATSIGLFPTVGNPGTAPVTLGVTTNAANGYALSACATVPTYNGHQISAFTTPSATLGTAGGDTGPGFGAKATNTGTGTLGSTWTSGNYTAYPSTCDTATPADVLADNSGPATDTYTLKNAAVLGGTEPAGNYTGTITYIVTPSY